MYSRDQIKRGIRNPRFAARLFGKRVVETVEAAIPLGTNIFERNWDVLLILDACRVDLFNEFAPNHDVYDLFETVSSMYTVASTTQKWLPRTFDDAPDELVANTHYVTNSPFGRDFINTDRLHAIDHVWKYAKSREHGQTRPKAMTDAGIQAIRESSADRVVIHYTQPHAPFIHCPHKYESEAVESGNSQEVWAGLKEGEFDANDIWQDYGTNLLRVLDEVYIIIKNTDGKVAITSDHGNGLGEWGVYGHPFWAVIPSVRKVPWATAEGLGLHEYEVKGRDAMTTDAIQTTVAGHLEALGYR